jgi:hypothetical protein
MKQGDWGGFLVAQIGASAALIGLLFVALSDQLGVYRPAAFLPLAVRFRLAGFDSGAH